MLTTIISGIITLALVWWFLKRFFWWIVGAFGALVAVLIIIEILQSSPRKKKVITIDTPKIDLDELDADSSLDDAAIFAITSGSVSVSSIQSQFGFGYARSSGLLDQLEAFGIIEPYNGSQTRKVLIGHSEYETNVRPKVLSAISKKEAYWEEQTKKAREEAENQLISYEDKRLSLYYVDNLDGHAFEEWCAELLLDNGFYDVAVTPGSGDQGVDVLAVKGGVKYAIQCKCYSHDLGNTPVQEVHAGKSLYGCHVGVVMTNRHFTSGAKQLADATGVLLWDREALQEMIEIAQQVIEV